MDRTYLYFAYLPANYGLSNFSLIGFVIPIIQNWNFISGWSLHTIGPENYYFLHKPNQCFNNAKFVFIVSLTRKIYENPCEKTLSV